MQLSVLYLAYIWMNIQVLLLYLHSDMLQLRAYILLFICIWTTKPTGSGAVSVVVMSCG